MKLFDLKISLVWQNSDNYFQDKPKKCVLYNLHFWGINSTLYSPSFLWWHDNKLGFPNYSSAFLWVKVMISKEMYVCGLDSYYFCSWHFWLQEMLQNVSLSMQLFNFRPSFQSFVSQNDDIHWKDESKVFKLCTILIFYSALYLHWFLVCQWKQIRKIRFINVLFNEVR
jgi:hypothetical protein